MSTISLLPNRRGYLSKILTDLLCCGWAIETGPDDGKIPRNGLGLVLKADTQELRLRIFVYKVTTSGRNRPHERRVEITTTYLSGLKRMRHFRDVVLGIDLTSGIYVGVDPRRLEIGGSTHNASSFFDIEGLAVKSGELLINPRATAHSQFTSGIELHAFFDRSRLSEYLFNQREIHAGSYAYGGAFCGRTLEKDVALPATIQATRPSSGAFVLASKLKGRRPTVSPNIIAAVERQDFVKLAKKGITPEQLKQILSLCDEIGALGEQAVLTAERKRLRKLKLLEQANKVERVSLRSVSAGYDIISFEDDGVTTRYLEVKATIGKSPFVDVSQGEWRAAEKYGSQYYLVRVTRVKDAPQIVYIQNPFHLLQNGLISRTATGWKVDLRKIPMAAKAV